MTKLIEAYTPEKLKVMTEPCVALTVGGMNWNTPPGVFVVAPTWIYTPVRPTTMQAR